MHMHRLIEIKVTFAVKFQVLLAMIIAWVICEILTATNALPDVPGKWGYNARTDTKIYVLQKSEWFRFPYPGLFGFFLVFYQMPYLFSLTSGDIYREVNEIRNFIGRMLLIFSYWRILNALTNRKLDQVKSVVHFSIAIFYWPC